MKVAVIGATGVVGRKMTEILSERNFSINTLIPVASERSVGQFIGADKIVTVKDALGMKPDIALFSAGSDISREWAPRFAEAGCRVIDNSSCWRMDPRIKLIVPEVNGCNLTPSDMIIANPNCSTIQMVVALARLHDKLKIKRIVVSTYQSVTGSVDMEQIVEILKQTPGVELQDNPELNQYPMPLYSFGKDQVFVGRVRRDFSTQNSINLWIVADNLRRGAATNAVMIAEQLTPFCKIS